MKKPFIAFSIACACATGAFADHGQYEQWQNPWFKAIGASATKTDTKSVGGAWAEFNEGVSFVEGKMVLDQDDDQSSTFNISADATNANTIVEVTATAAFYPVLEADLQTIDLPSGAKAAFAVVKDGNDLSYRALVAGTTGWVTLDGTPAEGEVAVLIQLNYRDGKAKFFVDGEEVSAEGGIAFSATAVPAGLNISGCGTVASVNAEVQVGVATYNGKTYGTITEAQAAAASQTGAPDPTVRVIVPTAEPVEIAGGVKIDDGGNMQGEVTVKEGAQLDIVVKEEEVGSGVSGTYTIPVKATGAGTVVLDLPTAVTTYKEIASQKAVAGGIEVELQTRGDIISNANEKAGCALEVNSNLRAFLTANAKTPYEAADANATAIGAALAAEGTNKLPLWQDYVLGIKPIDSVKPVTIPTGDVDADNISLAIPAIDTTKYSGDYNITYKVDETTCTGPSAIKVPLTKTATYQMKIVLTPKDND